RSHSSLLRMDSEIPVLTKVADAATVLTNPDALNQLSADLYAHDLYRYLLQRKYPQTSLPDDYHSSPRII
ncbi:MAG: hypothetical protein K2J67_07580, partial [Lachnospiraceae bacterium]|nr:hypothetical protein [Lachnospiraceae bacterium]